MSGDRVSEHRLKVPPPLAHDADKPTDRLAVPHAVEVAGDVQLLERLRDVGYRAGDPLPGLLRDVDLMRLLGMREDVFYPLKKSGRFRRFEVRPQLTKTTRYSGSLLRAWLDGKLDDARFLSSARRRSA